MPAYINRNRSTTDLRYSLDNLQDNSCPLIGDGVATAEHVFTFLKRYSWSVMLNVEAIVQFANRDRYNGSYGGFTTRRIAEESIDVLGAMFASDYGDVGKIPGDHDPPGAEAVRIGIERPRTPVPNIRFDVPCVFVDDETAIAHLDIEGIHDGPWIIGPDDDAFIAEPTGLTVAFRGHPIISIRSRTS